MGAIAAELADDVVVTDDNPRTEVAASHRRATSSPAFRRGRACRVEHDRAHGDRDAPCWLPRPATWCWSPARVTRTTRSSAASSAPFSDQQVVRAALARAHGGARMNRSLSAIRAHLRRRAASAPIAPSRRVDRHAHAASRASCSSRCAARASTATISSRRPQPRAPPARWSTRASTAPWRRCWSRDTQRGADAGVGRAWRAQFHAARRRRRRQQRQDHVEGNDRARSSRSAGPTLATRGNLNNHIGVPLTLLRLDAEHRFAVIEIGANHAGRSRRARASSRDPTVGLITNAGAEHLEGFGSIEGVARAEGEMVAGLAARRPSRCINADDEFARCGAA